MGQTNSIDEEEEDTLTSSTLVMDPDLNLTYTESELDVEEFISSNNLDRPTDSHGIYVNCSSSNTVPKQVYDSSKVIIQESGKDLLHAPVLYPLNDM